jgi:hypothetical protein
MKSREEIGSFRFREALRRKNKSIDVHYKDNHEENQSDISFGEGSPIKYTPLEETNMSKNYPIVLNQINNSEKT